MDFRIQTELSQRPTQYSGDSASSGDVITEEDERTTVTLESTENEEKKKRKNSKQKKKNSVTGPSRSSLSDRDERVNHRWELRHQIEIRAHEKKYTELNRQYQQERNQLHRLLKEQRKEIVEDNSVRPEEEGFCRNPTVIKETREIPSFSGQLSEIKQRRYYSCYSCYSCVSGLLLLFLFFSCVLGVILCFRLFDILLIPVIIK